MLKQIPIKGKPMQILRVDLVRGLGEMMSLMLTIQ
jgi:hypothetical protein